MDFKKLITRTISGIIYIGIILAGIFLNIPGVVGLGIVLGVVATIEFERISSGESGPGYVGLVLDLLGVISLAFFCLNPGLSILCWFIIFMARMVTELYTKDKDPLNSIAHSFTAQAYIGLPMALMGVVSEMMGSTHILLALFIMLWINDTGAFLVGSMFGKHRLFERISPKKSWEGFWGGYVFNLIFAVIINYCASSFFALPSNIWIWIGLATIVTVFGTWGDLIESMIKRELHIKDSGNIIPGHGGILDRIDSLLLVMPAAFVYFSLLHMFI